MIYLVIYCIPYSVSLQSMCWILDTLPLNCPLINFAFICSFQFILCMWLHCTIVLDIVCGHILWFKHVLTRCGSSCILQCAHVCSHYNEYVFYCCLASVLVFVFLCGATLFAVALLICAVAQPDLQTIPYAAPACLHHDQVRVTR